MTDDLSRFETDLVLRPLVMADFDPLIELSKRCFPSIEPWTLANVRNQLAVWERSQLGLFIDGRLVASCAQLVVSSDDYSDFSDWREMADGGNITNHDLSGDTLYGIEIQVDPGYRGMKLARRLYDARKDIVRELDLAYIVIGGRIPGYSAHAEDMTPAEYVEAVRLKRLYDPVLTSQLSNGFRVREIVEAYLPDDEDSAGYATCLEWANLDHVRHRGPLRRRATLPVRTALVQYKMRRISDFDDFVRQVTFFVDTASDYRSDFVVFPELFTLQLLSLLGPTRPGTAARAVADFTERYIELFSQLSMRYNINIIGGSTFDVREDTLYNTAFVFRRDGSIASQDKLHVTPSEARWWGVQGGDTVAPIDTDRGRIGVLICYDVEFPELGRVLAADGVRLLFVPYNTHDRYGHMRVRTCASARCIENHFFAVTAGCVGNLPFVENADVHYAQSAVLTPSDVAFARDGIAIQAEPDIETVLPHDLDLEAVRRHRRQGTVRPWRDRRTDLYSVKWKKSGREV